MRPAVVKQSIMFRFPFGALGGVSLPDARIDSFSIGDGLRVTERLDAPIALEVGHDWRRLRSRKAELTREKGGRK